VVSSRLDLPRLAAGEKPYIVRQGDNYANIASTVGVDEGDLRLINKHADIIPGLLLKVPPKRAVVTPTVAMEEMPPVAVTTGMDDLVAVVDESPAPKAKMIKPNVDHSTQPKTSQVAASGKKYVVQNGDSIWRIANRFKVSQEKVMKLNGISDARKIKAGMKLEIPQ
jgi:LysM repeat protein